MNQLLTEFLSESRDHLDKAITDCITLEKSPNDYSVLNHLFRAVHTIKGASGLFDIGPFTQLAHAAEDLLDTFRTGGLSLNSEMVDLLLESMDQIRKWLQNLEEYEALPDTSETIAEDKSLRLRSFIPPERDNINQNPNHLPRAHNSGRNMNTRQIPLWLNEIPEDQRRLWYQELPEEKHLVTLTYKPDERCFYSGEDPIYTIRQIPGLLWLGIEITEPWPALQDFNPYSCHLFFNLLTTDSQAELNELFRYVAKEIDLSLIKTKHLVFPSGFSSETAPFDFFIQDAQSLLKQKNWSELKRLAEIALEIAGPDTYQASALRWLIFILEEKCPSFELAASLIKALFAGTWEMMANGNQGLKKNDDSLPTACSLWKFDPDLKIAAQHILKAQLDILVTPCTQENRGGRQASIVTVFNRAITTLGFTDLISHIPQAVAAAVEEHDLSLLTELTDLVISRLDAPDQHPQQVRILREKEYIDESANCGELLRKNDRNEESEAASKQQIKSLKVDLDKIDVLMDLAGELVVAKNAMPFLAKKALDVHGLQDFSREIKNQFAVINRITDDLQQAVMQVRMMAVAHLFQRFPRLVRDLARKQGKQIRLVIEGEETEADKNIVEALADPLIHIVRNCIDHGIEPPEVRIGLGKNPEGQIRLRAYQNSDQVVIEVTDDGRGVDPSKIKEKAYEKGLINEDVLDSLSEDQAQQLIFAPGFSTAESITDISGRGVGMDVVRTMVMDNNGSVNLQSTVGQGTTIQLFLPLSMAISRVLMIEVSGDCYGVPFENVIETVKVSSKGIHRIKNQEMVLLRHRLLPIMRMNSLLNLKSFKKSLDEEESVLVVKVGGEEVGLVIDGFNEGVDVILKPLEGILSSFSIYSGTALLGDGRVLLVLNLRTLLA